MTTRRRPERDKLDDWLDIWAREIPSLDRTTEGVVERIGHLAKDLDRSMEDFRCDGASLLEHAC